MSDVRIVEAGLNFGGAIAALKAGKSVSRAGWNGKGMHLYLENGRITEVAGGRHAGLVVDVQPVIYLVNVAGQHQPGWLASQPDMLADDWTIVE